VEVANKVFEELSLWISARYLSLLPFSNSFLGRQIDTGVIYCLFVRLVADGWCWFVLREKYCWLVAGGWFVLREKYCWLVADKPSEQGEFL
jgi:hypothetical protein